MFYIYGLLNDDLLRYIGKTNDPKTRYARHLRGKLQTHTSSWIASLKAKGIKPTIILLEEFANEAESLQAEQFYISYFRYLGANLTNHTDGGEGTTGYRHTEIAKRRMSQKRKGKNHHFYGIKGAANPNFGQKRPAQGPKISAALKGKKLSKEHRKNISLAQQGRKQSKETIAKRRATILKNGGYGGWKHTPEALEKMSGSKNPRYGKTGSQTYNSKPVARIDPESHAIFEKYESISLAAKSMGVSPGTITGAIRRKRKSCGYYWKCQ